MAPSACVWRSSVNGKGTLSVSFRAVAARDRHCDRPVVFSEGNRSRNSRVFSTNGAGGARVTRKTGTGKYEQMLETCKNMKPIPTAVAHPCEESALAGAIEAAKRGIIVPILVG